MTIAYFDCFSGISGDMTLGALVDCGADRALLDAVVEALRLGDEVRVEVRHEARGHTGGTRVLVGVTDGVERTVPALRRVVEEADLPDPVKPPTLQPINPLARPEAPIPDGAGADLHLHQLRRADTLVDTVRPLLPP